MSFVFHASVLGLISR